MILNQIFLKNNAATKVIKQVAEILGKASSIEANYGVVISGTHTCENIKLSLLPRTKMFGENIPKVYQFLRTLNYELNLRY